MDPERFFDVQERLRRAGLPRPPLYRRAEDLRMQQEEARRQRRRLQGQFARQEREGLDPSVYEADLGAMGDEGRGPRPRAEPDQVVKQVEKGADG